MKIVCCVFAYNCENQITRTLSKLLAIRRIHLISEILIIENSSEDDTVKRIQEFFATRDQQSPVVTIRKNNRNYGLGGSHKIAIQFALNVEASWVLFLHGDDQANPSDLDTAIDLIRNNEFSEFDAFLGSRFIEGSKLLGYNYVRELGNRILNIVYTVKLGKVVSELGAGLSAHKVEHFKNQRFMQYTSDFHFYTYMLRDYLFQRKKIHFFPIEWSEVDQKSNVRNIHIGLNTLKTAFVDFSKLPNWRRPDIQFEFVDEQIHGHSVR